VPGVSDPNPSFLLTLHTEACAYRKCRCQVRQREREIDPEVVRLRRADELDRLHDPVLLVALRLCRIRRIAGVDHQPLPVDV
jgi:hypothetical protein